MFVAATLRFNRCSERGAGLTLTTAALIRRLVVNFGEPDVDLKLLLSKLEQKKVLQKKLKLEHAKALEAIDGQIRELHEKRARITIRNKEATDALQREIVELAREAKRVHVRMTAQAQAQAASPEPVGAPAGSDADSGDAPPNPPAGHAADPAAARIEPERPSSRGADDSAQAILELLKSRGEMSESLLREKLRSKGIKVSELTNRLDKMVKQGVLQRRANNYSLGKKR